ncbi:MAG: hypothetical protein ACKO1L_00460, partial [Brachymonas sp.]
YPLWITQCGAAIGKPGTAHTPMCANFVAEAIASCSIKLSLPQGQQAAPSGGTAPTFNSGVGQASGGSVSANVGSAAVLAGTVNPQSAATQQLYAVQVATCKEEAQAALAIYAQRHAVNPQSDKPYPPSQHTIDDLKKTTPAVLVASASGLGNLGLLGGGSTPRGASGREGAASGDARDRFNTGSDSARDRSGAARDSTNERGNAPIENVRDPRGANPRAEDAARGSAASAPDARDARATLDPRSSPTTPAPGAAGSQRAMGLPTLPGMTSSRGNEAAGGSRAPGAGDTQQARLGQLPPTDGTNPPGGGGRETPRVGLPAAPGMAAPPGSQDATPRTNEAAARQLPGPASPPAALPPFGARPVPNTPPPPSGPVGGALPAMPALAGMPAAPAPDRPVPAALPTTPPASPPTTPPLQTASLAPDQQLRAATCTHASLGRGQAMPSTPPADGAYSCPAGPALTLCETLLRSNPLLVKRCQVVAR